MRMRSPRRHALAAGLAVTALAMASAVAATAGAVPARAASCSAGYVGLSFDDGPSNAHTPALLNALKQNGLRATLFNEGQFASSVPGRLLSDAPARPGGDDATHLHVPSRRAVGRPEHGRNDRRLRARPRHPDERVELPPEPAD